MHIESCMMFSACFVFLQFTDCFPGSGVALKSSVQENNLLMAWILPGNSEKNRSNTAALLTDKQGFVAYRSAGTGDL